jgi:coenzyme F420-reducing hydrogenase beta subunit
MTDDTTQVKSEALTKVNRLAVVSIICAAIALAGTFRVGVVVIAVFAVGAGHVSLQQINARHERGAILAYIALGVSYLIATVALFQALYFALAVV